MAVNQTTPSTHFQPVPDGRFYTKANFFSIRNNSREAGISEHYQTDVEPRDQEAFEEMLQRRRQMH
jgi:uncharacterized protein YaiI (UPF0178 family)